MERLATEGVTSKGTESGSIVLWADHFRNGSKTDRQQSKAEVLSVWVLLP